MPPFASETKCQLVRIPDKVASIIKSPGGKHSLSSKLAALAPLKITEFREPFASSAATLFRVLRSRRTDKVWLNDIDPGVFGFWMAVRDDSDALMQELYGLHDRYGLGSQEMFDIACQMVDSDVRAEAAAGFYVRNHLSMSGTNGMSSYNPSNVRLGRGIKRLHINYIPQFSAWLQGAEITNLDYREVLAAPGKNVFIYLDPPYSGVGRTMYPFGTTALDELAVNVLKSRHSCLLTVDDSPTNRVLFSDISIIARTYTSSMGKHHIARELVCANYTTPLFDIHAQTIGQKIDANSTIPVPINDEQQTFPERIKTTHVRNLFISKGGEQKNCEWYTPPWLLQHLYSANDNRPFDLDPCSPMKGDDAPVRALQHFTIDDDGLRQEWHGRVWLNPPYHSLKHWTRKAADAVWCRHMPNPPTEESALREQPLCEAVVGIIPVRTHARYWRDYVSEHAAVFFVAGKIGFLKGVDGRGVEVSSQMTEGVAIVIWGNHQPFSDYLKRLPKTEIDIYERSGDGIHNHPVRYWSQLKMAA